MPDVTQDPGALIIIKGLDFGGKSGGSDKFGLELCLALSKIGCKTGICVYNRFNSLAENRALSSLESNKIPVLFLKGKSTFLKLFNKQVHNFCQEHQLTIAHSHFQVGSLLAIYLKLRKTVQKIVRTAHTPQEWGTGWIPRIFRQIFTKWLFPHLFDAQIGVSQSIVDEINTYKSMQKARRIAQVIYNGIPTSWFSDNDTTQPTFTKEPHLIGGIGLLVPLKGFKQLLFAMPNIIEVYPSADLIILGDGPFRSELEKTADALGLKSHVQFVGQQTDVRFWLEKMDLFVLPSLLEGLPTVVLESMACRVPVIATDIQGVRELVIDGKTGWLVPVNSPDAIASRVIYAFSHEAEKHLIRENAYHWAERFTIEAAAQQYYELYKSLIIGGIKI